VNPSTSWFGQLVSMIESGAKTFESEALATIEAVGEAVIPFAEDFLQQIAGFALEAVTSEATKTISGQGKFGSAVTHVIQKVEGAGKQIGVNDAHGAVQAAYNALKARLPS
jgi:hypothetical protein